MNGNTSPVPSYGQNRPQHFQSCYNCGAQDHWAQHCPEPRRVVPAGGSSQPNEQRPVKRHKSNAPIITRYPPPPGYQQNRPYGGQGRPQAFQPQYSSRNHTYPPPIVPPPNSQALSHWQTPQYGPIIPPQQQGPNYIQYTAPGGSNHAMQYGNKHGVSPSIYQHQQQMSPSYQVQPQQEYLSPSTYQPQTPASPFSPHAQMGFRERTGSAQTSFEIETGHSSSEIITPVKSTSTGLFVDSPEAPQAQVNLKPTVWHPANRVAKALPSIFSAAENSNPVATIAPDTDGSASKYFNKGNLEEISLSVRDTADWATVQSDPVFRILRDDCELIPLHQLSFFRSHTVKAPTESPEAEEKEDGEIIDLEVESFDESNRIDGKDWNVMGNLQEAVTPEKSRNEPLASLERETIDISEMESLYQAEESTEEKLARLGVTGQPKPVIPTAPWSSNQSTAKTPISESFSDHRNVHGSSFGNGGSSHGPMDENQPPLNTMRNVQETSYDDLYTQNPRHHNMQSVPRPSPPAGSYTHQGHRSTVHRTSIGAVDGTMDSGGGDPAGQLPNENENANPRKRAHELLSDNDKPFPEDTHDDKPRLKKRNSTIADAYSRRW